MKQKPPTKLTRLPVMTATHQRRCVAGWPASSVSRLPKHSWTPAYAVDLGVFEAKMRQRQVREQDVLARTGKQMSGRKPDPFIPDPDVRVNVVDPESRVMKTNAATCKGSTLKQSPPRIRSSLPLRYPTTVAILASSNRWSEPPTTR